MKSTLKNIFLLFISVCFLACGDDNKSEILRYSESTIETFKLYAGSDAGGVDILTDTLEIKKYFPDAFFDSYSGTTITFVDDLIAIGESSGLAEVSEYEFRDGSLYIHRANQFVYYGEGDQQTLYIRQHYIGYRQPGNRSFIYMQALPQKNIDAEAAAELTPFGTVEGMKSDLDTLIWCTRSSLFWR